MSRCSECKAAIHGPFTLVLARNPPTRLHEDPLLLTALTCSKMNREQSRTANRHGRNRHGAAPLGIPGQGSAGKIRGSGNTRGPFVFGSITASAAVSGCVASFGWVGLARASSDHLPTGSPTIRLPSAPPSPWDDLTARQKAKSRVAGRSQRDLGFN
jgi:hypothetical protein